MSITLLAGLVIRRGDDDSHEILLVSFGRHWTVPGGNPSTRLNDEQALERKILHQAGVKVEAGHTITTVTSDADEDTPPGEHRGHIRTHWWICSFISELPDERYRPNAPITGRQWLSVDELPALRPLRRQLALFLEQFPVDQGHDEIWRRAGAN